ncbi:MAG: response regulator, partial [Candidatus Marinimicrobia bacterium]|nr:response regulator [Candidatus Neomarinimicrobiota bacterium]
RILILDDNQVNTDLLEEIVSNAGYTSVLAITDSREVKNIYKAYQPHLVLLDINMPHLDGYEVMEIFKKIDQESYIPVLVLTALQDDKTRLKALASGAQDFLTKPFNKVEALTRIHNMLKVRLLHNQVQNQNIILEQKVKIRTLELENTRLEIIRRLGQAAEYRDTETGGHIIRMSKMCALLGRLTGMNDSQIDLLLNASPMHDVGKIGIPDSILLKPGKLTPEEWETMTQHSVIGGNLLDGHDSELMTMARDIALTHHEKWDGMGYPNKLKGDKIPIYGRIAALADVFDALTSRRPYKNPYPMEKTLEIIKQGNNAHFEPKLVDLFLNNIDAFVKIKNELSDDEYQVNDEFYLSERDRT